MWPFSFAELKPPGPSNSKGGMTRNREYLIAGYVRDQENKLSLFGWDKGINRMIAEYYSLWEFRFGHHDTSKFRVSTDGQVLRSIDSNSCSGFMVYGEGINEEQGGGFDHGIHSWSLQSLSDRSGSCYQSIGVTRMRPSDKNAADRSSHWMSCCDGSHFQGYTQWIKGMIVTIRLDCEQWRVTYFRGTEKLRTDEIKRGKYYMVLSVCCAKDMVHLQTVQCPVEHQQ